MVTRADLLRQSKEARASAARAHRLAASWAITNPDDTARLSADAAAMDQKAKDLEAQALAAELSIPSPSTVVTHSQEKAQQQVDALATTPRAELAKGPTEDGTG